MNKTQLYIGTDLLDFKDEVNIKLQCYDMRSSQIGNSNKSYTLNIPLTRGNKNILEHAHLINSRKQITERARLVLGGIELIRGLPRVLGINNKSIKIIIDSDDWVADISGVSLRDLSWTAPDTHTFNGTNVEASWGAANGFLYRYPLINFAELYTQEFGANAGIIPNDFVTMWNISQIVTKIFEDDGYVITGFFDDSAIKEYYILSEEQVADEDFITNKALDVSVTNDSDNEDSITHGPGVPDTVSLIVNPVVMTTEATDEGGDYASNTYTVPVDGTYRFLANVVMFCTHNNNGNFSIITQSINYNILKNGSSVAAINPSSTTLFDAGNGFNLDSGWIYAEAGDTITMSISASSRATNIGPLATVFLRMVSGSSTFENTWDKRNLYKGVGQTINPATELPDIDGLDFLIALKELFNLRFWLDQYNKTIYIESDPEFVGSTVVDWSDKVDFSKKIGQEIIAASYKKKQVWQYAPDTGDKAYTNHVANNGIPFTKEVTLTNASVQPGTDTRENSIFSPTVTGKMPQIADRTGQLPRIFSGDDFVSDVKPYPAHRAKKWNPRILIWVSPSASLTTGSWRWYESMQDFEDGVFDAKSTFPKAITPDYSDLYDNHWSRSFHFIDGSRALTATLVLNPSDLMAFITVVGTAANEGFRATYKLNVEDVDMYFYITRIISDGMLGKLTAIQKM